MRKLSERDWCGTRRNLHSLTLLPTYSRKKYHVSRESKAEIQLRGKSNLKAFVFPARQPLLLESKADSRATFNVHLEDYELYTKLIRFLTSRLENDRYIKRISANASEKSRFAESFRIYEQPPLDEPIYFCSK